MPSKNYRHHKYHDQHNIDTGAQHYCCFNVYLKNGSFNKCNDTKTNMRDVLKLETT
jgi:hypothetical protein